MDPAGSQPEGRAVTAHVSVDADLCIGSADCVRLVPTAFVIDESSGVSTPLAQAGDAPIELLVEAAVGCPTNAIAVVAEDGEVLVASNG